MQDELVGDETFAEMIRDQSFPIRGFPPNDQMRSNLTELMLRLKEIEVGGGVKMKKKKKKVKTLGGLAIFF